MTDSERDTKAPVFSGIMEGMISFRSVIAGIESGVSDRRIFKVYFDSKKKCSSAGHLSYIKAMSFKHGFELEMCDKSVIDSLAVGSTHGGIVTLCGERSFPDISPEAVKGKKFFMLLDGIEDPYNFGYALRSLYAAGVDGVVMPRVNRMNDAGIVCRSSAGASEQMPLYVGDLSLVLSVFGGAGYRVVCADIANSVPVWDADLSFPLLTVIGGEKRGIGAELLSASDEIVRIDYGREFPSALSAASASSVIAFEVFRQNRRAAH